MIKNRRARTSPAARSRRQSTSTTPSPRCRDRDCPPIWIEAVAAIVVPRDGVELTAEELKTHTRARLAAFQSAQAFAFVDTLPKNPSGKLLKREMRQQYAHLAATISGGRAAAAPEACAGERLAVTGWRPCEVRVSMIPSVDPRAHERGDADAVRLLPEQSGEPVRLRPVGPGAGSMTARPRGRGVCVARALDSLAFRASDRKSSADRRVEGDLEA